MAKPKQTKSEQGGTGFKGELGIKIIRAKRPGLLRRIKDWLATAIPK